MHELFLEVLILSGITTIVATACSYAHIPTMVGFIFTGIIIGPSGLGWVESLPHAHSLTELVGIVLLFTIGLEFPFSKLRDLKHQFFRLGTSQVLLSIFSVMALGFWSIGSFTPRVVLWGFIISLSSTALVLKLLHDYREIHTPHGQNAIGILLFQDVAVLAMMLALPLMAHKGQGTLIFSFEDLLIWMLKISAILVGILLAKRHLLPLLSDLILKTRSQEVFFFAIIFMTLGIGYLFNLANLSLALGAFVAGILISETAFGSQTMTIFNSLRDTLLGLFFASVGMLLDLQFISTNLGSVVLNCLAFFAFKFLIIFFVCVVNRVTLSTSIMTALVLCQVGEFSFLLVSNAATLQIFTPHDHQIFLAISIISMALTPIFYLLAPKIAFSRAVRQIHAASTTNPQQELSIIPSASPHTIVIGFGIAGRKVLKALKSLGISCKAIESSFKIVKLERARGTDIYYGDASFPEVLKQADLKNACSVVIAISGSSPLPHIINSIRQINPNVKILIRTQYLHELKDLKKDENLQVVVAEIETITELLTKVLQSYNIEEEEVSKYINKTRAKLEKISDSAWA